MNHGIRVGIDLAPLTYTVTGIGVYVQQLVEAVSKERPELEWHFPIFSELPSCSFFRWRIAKNLQKETVSRVTIWPEWAFRPRRR